ncbi:nuclear receptor subfamily 6 group A member 1-like [Haliotis cracherodii]|uniref:nuclear receptor subfamily 6 group A member 1-like n=1 Tax=Haliotis cracherodii TaxID=6455 RepID=UPI0039E8DABB
MTAFVSSRYHLPMETSGCDKSLYRAPSMFRDFKLKRKRVQDIFGSDTESGTFNTKLNESSDCDRQSDVSSESVDSAYISDRASDISDRRSIDEPPLKTCRTSEDDSARKFDHFTQQIKNSEPGGTNKNLSMGMTYFGFPPAYMNMLQNHGVSQVPGLVPTGMRFIPVMGTMPGLMPASLPNMSTPMFVAAPPSGFMFSSSGTMMDKNVPLFNLPTNNGSHMNIASGTSQQKLDSSSNFKSSKATGNEKFCKEQDFIAHYTNGKFVYSGHLAEKDIRPNDRSTDQSEHKDYESDPEEQMICAICNDRATGLHYGIITCEGCKGFFKRTVQNKRVYTCVSDGDCEINKAQRNRCQYCRFKKCLQMGMVLAAVREDRMPGGRNSGAVYNLYKVKYKKHKRRDASGRMYKQRVAQIKVNCDGHIATETVTGGYKEPINWPAVADRSQNLPLTQTHPMKNSQPLVMRNAAPPMTIKENMHMFPGSEMYDRRSDTQHRILTTQVLTDTESRMSVEDSSHTLGDERSFMDSPGSYQSTALMSPVSNTSSTSYQALSPNSNPDTEHLIDELMHVDSLLGIAESYRIDQFAGSEDSVAQTLCKIGDDIVVKLVQWIRQLPFYREIPVDVQSQILTNKWHELLLLIMTAYGAVNTKPEDETPSYNDLYQRNMQKMQWYLNNTFGKSFSIDQLHSEIGDVMEKVTHIMSSFYQMSLSIQEYVCLQIILLLNHNDANPSQVMEKVQDRYMTGLQTYVHTHYPNEPNRFGELLLQLPQIQAASSLLLKSKMIYIPFLLNS